MIWRSRYVVGVHDHRFGRLECDRQASSHDAGLLDGSGRLNALAVDGLAPERAPGVEPRQQPGSRPSGEVGGGAARAIKLRQPQQLPPAGLTTLAVSGSPAHRGQAI